MAACLESMPVEILLAVRGYVDDAFGLDSFYKVFPDLKQFDSYWRDGTGWFVELLPVVGECPTCTPMPISYDDCPYGPVEFKGYLFRGNVVPPRIVCRDSAVVRLTDSDAHETLKTMVYKADVYRPVDDGTMGCRANFFNLLEPFGDGPERLVVESVPLQWVVVPPLYVDVFRSCETTTRNEELGNIDDICYFIKYHELKFAAEVVGSPIGDDDRSWIERLPYPERETVPRPGGYAREGDRQPDSFVP